MVGIPRQAQNKSALAGAARSRATIYHALAEALAGPVFLGSSAYYWMQ